MTDNKKFTYAQVKEHNKATDLWMVINERVYDVTKFLNEVGHGISYVMNILIDFFFYSTNQHPGGEEVLIEVAGKDGNVKYIYIYISDRTTYYFIDFFLSYKGI